jgi:hypothetical protein
MALATCTSFLCPALPLQPPLQFDSSSKVEEDESMVMVLDRLARTSQVVMLVVMLVVVVVVMLVVVVVVMLVVVVIVVAVIVVMVVAMMVLGSASGCIHDGDMIACISAFILTNCKYRKCTRSTRRSWSR